ncbi:MAG: hypothetical protein JXQ72_13460 [Anaerolineae bacterium]|nr:hypothetical protein [Anaerolineae bacterium]
MTKKRVLAKRTRWAAMIILGVLLITMLAACGSSPKDRADEFVSKLPAEFGEWERNDKETVRLLSSTVTSIGHVALTYEGPDDALAFLVIEAHPSQDAAEVARASRLREWMLQGLALDRDRAPQKATAEVAQTERVRYALFQEQTIVVEIDVLAAEGEAPVSDEAFGELLTVIREIYALVIDD